MTRSALALFVLLAACAAPPPPRVAPPPPPPAPPPPDAPPTIVWTREPGLALIGQGPASVPFVASRLDVLEVRPDSFLVRCSGCPGAPSGWVARERVAWEQRPPADARQGDLAEFVAALRGAAMRREWEAMRSVMSRNFVHAISGPDGTLEAIGAWRAHRAADLSRLPALLDRGATLVPGTNVWAAPPEFANLRGYADLRAGFIHGSAGWEWVFLVRNEI